MKNVHYVSNFLVSDYALGILRQGRIIGEKETPHSMIERVVKEIARSELNFGSDSKKAQKFADELGELLDNQKIVFSTPVLTNAGRETKKPLSACVVPPIDLKSDLAKIKTIVDTYHQEAIGTGFNLDEADDPIKMLRFLNQVAIEGSLSGLEDRPVGNMAVLSVDHPKIKSFIVEKLRSDTNWKFNLSVNITDDFMNALKRKGSYRLKNGKNISAREVFDLLVASAYVCNDPGLIFMDRMNRDNPVPSLGPYTGVAPCAEVGLIPGESCQFGYLNLGNHVTNGVVDINQIIKSTEVLTRALDNALEVSINNFGIRESAEIMKAKRKIGIGICGTADMLVKIGLAYNTGKARIFMQDIVALINYVSKDYSFRLGMERGSFLSFPDSRYVHNPGFLENKYGLLETEHVSQKNWIELAEKIRTKKSLRNCSTISLPPTGRSGLLVGASTGIEPFFNLRRNDNGIHPTLLASLKKNNLDNKLNLDYIIKHGSCQNLDIPCSIKNLFRTATEIHFQDHLLMMSDVQKAVDESISKTINFISWATLQDVKKLFIDAHSLGLKGVTIYINRRNNKQPISLAK